MTKLKKCPFCGGEAVMLLGDDWYVECKSCLATTTHYSTEAEAIAVWNLRADEPTFTRQELKTINNIFKQRSNGEPKPFLEIVKSILAKCASALKGGGAQ